MRARNILLCLLTVYYLLRSIWLVFIIPPWQGPDEPMHLLLAISPSGGDQSEKLRVETERTVIQSMVNNGFWTLTGQYKPDPLPVVLRTSRFSPPATMYHRILGIWLRITGFWGERDSNSPTEESLVRALYAGRVFSVLLGLGALIFLSLFAHRVLDGPVTSLLPIFLMVSHPQLEFIGSCLNSDNLLVFLTASGLACVPFCAMYPRHRWSSIVLVIIAILAPVAKRAGLVLTATVIPVALMPWIRTRKQMIWGGIGIGVFIVSAITALWSLGMVTSMVKDVGESVGISGWVGNPPAGWWKIFFTHFWETFWGNFGWVQCPLDPWLYRILAILTAGLIFMAPFGYSRIWRGGRIIPWVLWVQVLLAVVQVVLALGLRYELGQGRHAFVGLPAMVFLVTLGIQGIFPRRLSGWAVIGIGIVFLICSEMVTWFVMLPCFAR